ncbi:MAG: hypothetical protein PVG11_03430 [Anaerolineae bacterium]
MTQPTPDENRRRKMIYWLFTLTVAMWALAFALFYVVYIAEVVVVGGSALGSAFVSSLVVLLLAAVLSVAVYFISDRLA